MPVDVPVDVHHQWQAQPLPSHAERLQLPSYAVRHVVEQLWGAQGAQQVPGHDPPTFDFQPWPRGHGAS